MFECAYYVWIILGNYPCCSTKGGAMLSERHCSKVLCVKEKVRTRQLRSECSHTQKEPQYCNKYCEKYCAKYCTKYCTRYCTKYLPKKKWEQYSCSLCTVRMQYSASIGGGWILHSYFCLDLQPDSSKLFIWGHFLCKTWESKVFWTWWISKYQAFKSKNFDYVTNRPSYHFPFQPFKGAIKLLY